MSFSDLNTLYRQVIMDHYKNPKNNGTFENDALTVDMNNPTCGDRIQLQLQLVDGVVQDAKFTGEGCSISMASCSMMTEAVKGQKLEDALNMSKAFSNMMLGEEVDTDEMGDAAALQGVSQFPARIKCATLPWKAMEKGVKE
ncbi:SUF system NifU family Fe-S cluster assembly protein [Barrientosiimonas marina]|uniref:Fe-S cluster assembly sulfur transfer protein SufU n=1 Tax=Lentibacillus kimchii TaxID=1542911 RepID=A0ABW2UQU2_9BACI